MRCVCAGVTLALWSFPLRAQDAPEIPLWRGVAPGSESKSAPEKVRIAPAGDHVVSSVHRPTVTAYLPAKERATGTAIVVAPGGGHRELWIDHEGHNVARWLRDRGIAAFVLKYRLASEEGSTYTVDGEALSDMQRAIRLVRSRARTWGIDTSRIGVMGFSAGGELAALSAMRIDGMPHPADSIDALSSRPAFQALIYPGRSERFVAMKSSPPLFIAAGYKDRPDISRGMAELYLKYKDAGVPAELHMYATAGHGFGMRDGNRGPSAGWPNRLVEWLADIGMVAPRK
ncbi:MAG: alpha/beta hydrolase [bacterium]